MNCSKTLIISVCKTEDGLPVGKVSRATQCGSEKTEECQTQLPFSMVWKTSRKTSTSFTQNTQALKIPQKFNSKEKDIWPVWKSWEKTWMQRIPSSFQSSVNHLMLKWSVTSGFLTVITRPSSTVTAASGGPTLTQDPPKKKVSKLASIISTEASSQKSRVKTKTSPWSLFCSQADPWSSMTFWNNPTPLSVHSCQEPQEARVSSTLFLETIILSQRANQTEPTLCHSTGPDLKIHWNSSLIMQLMVKSPESRIHCSWQVMAWALPEEIEEKGDPSLWFKQKFESERINIF